MRLSRYISLLKSPRYVAGRTRRASLRLTARGLATLRKACERLVARIRPCVDRDELIRSNLNGVSCWMLRRGALSLRIPDTGEAHAESGSPECELSAGVHSGVTHGRERVTGPRVLVDGRECTCCDAPSIQMLAGELRLTYRDLHPGQRHRPCGEKREVRYRARQDVLEVVERWEFDKQPRSLSLCIPEGEVPFRIRLERGNRDNERTFAIRPVQGIWHQYNDSTDLHSFDFKPERVVEFSYVIQPKLRVLQLPADHDYLKALYGAMETESLVAKGIGQRRNCTEMNADKFLGDADLLHIGWPEHMFRRNQLPVEQFERRYLDFIDAVSRSPVRVVWTLHNLLPHSWPDRETLGHRIYQAWARAADAAIHHSDWGRRQACEKLPFRDDTLHVVIPHGHYARQMVFTATREELEQEYGLRPCAMRFGVVGIPHPSKRVDMIMRAFVEAGRQDQQLLVGALSPDDDYPRDSRLIAMLRDGGILPRETIAKQVKLCDALIGAQSQATHLTSGAPADSIGMGIGMIATDWEFFREYLGDSATYFDGSEGGLREVFARIEDADIAEMKTASVALQQTFEWASVAARTLDLFNQICARTPRHAEPTAFREPLRERGTIASKSKGVA